MQDWKRQRGNFVAIAFAPTLWLLLFFAVPLAIMWAFSFGTNEGLTSININGTFANYARAIEPLYLEIFGKSVAVAALTTVICLVVGFPIAMAIAFASAKWKPWLLLLIMLPSATLANFQCRLQGSDVFFPFCARSEGLASTSVCRCCNRFRLPNTAAPRKGCDNVFSV